MYKQNWSEHFFFPYTNGNLELFKISNIWNFSNILHYFTYFHILYCTTLYYITIYYNIHTTTKVSSSHMYGDYLQHWTSCVLWTRCDDCVACVEYWFKHNEFASPSSTKILTFIELQHYMFWYGYTEYQWFALVYYGTRW